MIRVTVTNSMCQVENMPHDAESLIKEQLRYTNESVSYSYYKNLREMSRIQNILSNPKLIGDRQGLEKEYRRLSFINQGLHKKLYVTLYKKGEFPTGLLPKFKSVLDDARLPYEINDLRKAPANNKVKYILREQFPLLRYYQRTAARLVKEKGRGIIVAPTGTGKTLTVARMIWELGVKTLIVTPSKSITDNMVDTLSKYFGKGKVAKLTTKSSKTKDINVCNIQALVRLPAELLADVDAVFIDEFHHAAAETYQTANMNHFKNAYYRIGVTATNFRNDGADLSLEAVLSEVLYEYTIEQALKDDFLVKPEFRIIKTNARPQDTYQQELKLGLVQNVDRNKKIAELAMNHKDDSVIILVQQIEHGEALKELIPGSYFLHGEEKDDIRQEVMQAYRDGDIKCLIGTSVIGEGVDLPRAKILIMAGGGKARSAIMQNVGRVLRPFEGKDKAVVYDFTDDGSNYLSEHSLLRRGIYEIYKVAA